MDMKLEVVVVPVSDVDRAKEFYGGLGWRLDADFAAGDGWRVVQFTPPGSGCSVIFGRDVTAAAPGSAQGLYLVVSDIEAARDELLGRGVEVGEVFHDAGDAHAGADEPYLFGRRRVAVWIPSAAAIARTPRSATRRQRLVAPGGHRTVARARGRGRHDVRLIGRARGRAPPCGGRARRARDPHGGRRDENWPDWYAEYIVREQAGKELPT